MSMPFTFDPSLEVLASMDKAGSPQQPYYTQLSSDLGLGMWGPESYKCKPGDLESDKRKENGRLAAKKYRERIKEDQMLLKEDLQKLKEDNTRLREENAALQKVLTLHTEKILRSIEGISLFVRATITSRNDSYNLNQEAPTNITHTSECSVHPDCNYYGDGYNYSNRFGAPIQLPLNDAVLPPPAADSTYSQATYNFGASTATDPYTSPGSSGSFHTTSDSHSTYNVFVFILILLLPAKLFPYIISGYVSAKNASRSAEMLNAVSLQANLRFPTSLGHKQSVPNYSSYSSLANYSVLGTRADDKPTETHQSALVPMVDAHVQVTPEASGNLFQLWERSSLTSDPQQTSLSLTSMNKTDLCQYYNSQGPAARNSVVEVIESELKRTCSATTDNRRLDDFIMEASDGS